MDEELIIAALSLDETLGDSFEKEEETEVEQDEDYQGCWCCD
jgi:hypothetical protein